MVVEKRQIEKYYGSLFLDSEVGLECLYMWSSRLIEAHHLDKELKPSSLLPSILHKIHPWGKADDAPEYSASIAGLWDYDTNDYSTLVKEVDGMFFGSNRSILSIGLFLRKNANYIAAFKKEKL